MELRKFLLDNSKFLNLRAIERKCVISDGALRRYLKGGSLASKHCDSVIELINGLSRFELTYNPTKAKKPTKEPTDWIKEPNLSKYKRIKKGVYERDGIRYESKYDGGFWVRVV